MSDRLQELAVFVRVGDSGSFSRAARDLNLSQPSVSRIVGALEARLGVKLLLRTTRRLTLTAAGAAFLERARDILAELENAEDAARGIDSLRGNLRLALPVVFGAREIVPRLRPFLQRHPLLRLDLQMSDTQQNLIADGIDIAIRIGRLQDSPFGARRLATLQRVVVAAPAYLETRGTPRTPADLAGHDCIFGPGGFGRDSWIFKRGQTVISVDVTGRVQADSGAGMLASVTAGLGVAIASTVMCGPELKAGRLVPLLDGYAVEPVEVHAVFPGGPRPAARIRALADYLGDALRVMPPGSS